MLRLCGLERPRPWLPSPRAWALDGCAATTVVRALQGAVEREVYCWFGELQVPTCCAAALPATTHLLSLMHRMRYE